MKKIFSMLMLTALIIVGACSTDYDDTELRSSSAQRVRSSMISLMCTHFQLLFLFFKLASNC